MFGKSKSRDNSQPQQTRNDKELPPVRTNAGAPDKDKVSSLEQFQERGYDSGFVYHEE